jgi:microcin C transport system substrate-binding protein
MRKSVASILAAVLLVALGGVAAAQAANRGIGFAMRGEPRYKAGFKSFEYVNPAAPRGGTVVYGTIGGFDSLNPFIVKGESAAGLGNLFETLMVSSLDEPFSKYGLLAETVEWPDDRSWVTFTLNARARFHDGQPVTAEDVVWTFETLRAKGAPFYRYYYKDVEKVDATSPRTVRFSFGAKPNPELMLIVSELPVLPKHYWQDKDFEATTLAPPVGSGPYRVKSVDPGRSIVYEFDNSWWGKDLPVNVGQNNFAAIRYDYYRDEGVEREAFKAGNIDIHVESTAKEWVTGYEIPAVQRNLIIKRKIPDNTPAGMQAFVFNTRREVFRDPKVREALSYAFDFEWSNKNLFYGEYTRSSSYFANSEFAATGLPGAAELKLLQKYKGRIADEVFTKAYQPPRTDGSGELRDGLRTALRLLGEAGWRVNGGKLVDSRSGKEMKFEILLVQPAFERIVLPFKQNLQRLGVEASVRTVDTAQYQNRVDSYDFDMVVTTWGQSLSPGNEQRDFWGSQAADTPGSRNLAGIKSPVIDELIEQIVSAPTRDDLVAACRALDRVLLWGHYVIPQWYQSSYRVLYWDRFAQPQVMPRYSIGIDTWWIDPGKAGSLDTRKRALR